VGLSVDSRLQRRKLRLRDNSEGLWSGSSDKSTLPSKHEALSSNPSAALPPQKNAHRDSDLAMITRKWWDSGLSSPYYPYVLTSLIWRKKGRLGEVARPHPRRPLRGFTLHWQGSWAGHQSIQWSWVGDSVLEKPGSGVALWQ
jgi:hypothetical protein